MKNISILGSTGSIGVQSLDVIKKCGYKAVALTANNNVSLMENQIREFSPFCAALLDSDAANDLRIRVADTSCRILAGEEGVCECAGVAQADIVINSIVGLAGLKPTIRALEGGKTLALANKESLVAGGHLVCDIAKSKSLRILPVDSEHSAIFQCLQGSAENKLKRIVLTASGGPFFGKTLDELRDVTIEQALNHPNWSMGAKITVDSATMFNKGLELIEAVRLFDVTPDMIDIVVHRESIIHSLIEYEDNSVIAQLGLPDMRIPIQYALTYPERFPSPAGQLNLAKIGNLSFYEPDYSVFDCINICKEAIAKDGLFPAGINSANEQANLLFRQGKIRFLQIAHLVRKSMEFIPCKKDFTLEDVFSVDKTVRDYINTMVYS